MTPAEPEVPTASGAPPALSQEINAATRSVHASLNRLITSRLPLALPPCAPSPRVYALGLQHFAHVYLAFEDAWRDVWARAGGDGGDDSDAESWTRVSSASSLSASATLTPSSSSSSISSSSSSANDNAAAANDATTLRALLAPLATPNLARTPRLRADLSALLALPTPAAIDASLSNSLSTSPAAAAFVAHIHAAVAQKPHLLLAYAWVMYMAVFSGGRWIRGQFLGAPEAWWREGLGEDEKEEGGLGFGLADRGLAFFHFGGGDDGEGVKDEFKARLAAAETLLSAEQRREVVAEAYVIFAGCEGLVRELDGVFATFAAVGAGAGAELSPAAAAKLLKEARAAHAAAASTSPSTSNNSNSSSSSGGGESSTEKKKSCPTNAAAATRQHPQPLCRKPCQAQTWRLAAAAGALLLTGAGWCAVHAVGGALRAGWEGGWEGVGALGLGLDAGVAVGVGA